MSICYFWRFCWVFDFLSSNKSETWSRTVYKYYVPGLHGDGGWTQEKKTRELWWWLMAWVGWWWFVLILSPQNTHKKLLLSDRKQTQQQSANVNGFRDTWFTLYGNMLCIWANFFSTAASFFFFLFSTCHWHMRTMDIRWEFIDQPNEKSKNNTKSGQPFEVAAVASYIHIRSVLLNQRPPLYVHMSFVCECRAATQAKYRM